MTLKTDLDLHWWPWIWYQWKGHVTTNTRVKYKGLNSYQSKDMANVEVLFFFKLSRPWRLTLTLTDDLHLVTNRKVLSKGLLMWNLKALTLPIKRYGQCKMFYRQTNSLTDKQTNGQAKNYMPPIYWWRPFDNIVGKGENAGNQHFFLFPQFFLSNKRQISWFDQAFLFRLESFCIWKNKKKLSKKT